MIGTSVKPTIIIMPLLAYNIVGSKLYRLGYGGGYYDRTIQSLGAEVTTIGIALDCLQHNFPIE
jgi:5-formyltetrahydrofolate cyclo-ligase